MKSFVLYAKILHGIEKHHLYSITKVIAGSTITSFALYMGTVTCDKFYTGYLKHTFELKD